MSRAQPAVKKKKRPAKRIDPRTRGQKLLLRFGWLIPVATLLVGVGILLITYAFAAIPLPKASDKLASSAEVYDVNGKLIGTFQDEVQRFLIDTEDLMKKNPYIENAIVAAEDRDFYSHNGVSVRGIVRAAWANISGGEVQQGGSTITQQYVKNAVLEDSSRTVTRKAREAVLAIKMERRYSKKQILGFYLNTIYLGRGAYGIEAAARAYFDKPALDLTLPEAAYLAGIIPSPNSYQPDEDKKAAKDRRNLVLDLMVQEGYIDQSEADKAKRGPVKLADNSAESLTKKKQTAAYFMEWIRKQYLYSEFKENLYTGGFKIYTSLDLDMQEAAEEAVYGTLTEPGDPPAALVSMTPTGEVRAMVGGKDGDNVKKARGFNYATDTPGRQPGSAFKPFTLLAAIEEGISPSSRFPGTSPMTIPDPLCAQGAEPWEVDNYGGSSYGTIDLNTATTNSVNTVYAQLVSEVGPEKVRDLVEAFGFAPKYGTEEIAAECALSLGGTVPVTPLELARAYAGFAGRGALPKVTPVLYITDSEGNCLKEYVLRKGDCEEEAKGAPEQVVEQNSVDVLTQSLTDVVESGTATAASVGLDGRPIAGKTGTGQENKDAWFGGYIRQLATVVWMGYPTDNGVQPLMHDCPDPELCRPVHGRDVTGGSFPAEMWAAFMSQAITVDEFADAIAFAVPVDVPDEVLNSPAPQPTTSPTPKPSKSPEPEPSPEPSATPKPSPTIKPSPTPKPSPSPSPNPTPTIDPSPTGGGGGGGGGETGTDGEDP